VSALRPSMDRHLHADTVEGCPGCTAPRPRLISLSHVLPHPPFWVECSNCGASGPNHGGKQGAILWWNRMVAGATSDRTAVVSEAPQSLDACPKCGYQGKVLESRERAFETRYCPSYFNAVGPGCSPASAVALGIFIRDVQLPRGEHLHRTCRRCGYLVITPCEGQEP
jgi:hypothetical protein